MHLQNLFVFFAHFCRFDVRIAGAVIVAKASRIYLYV